MKHAAPGSARLRGSRREAGRRRRDGSPGQPVPARSAPARLVTELPVARQPATEQPATGQRATGQPVPGQSAVSANNDRAVRLAELPYLIVLACTAGGLAVIRLGAQYVRSGTLVLAGVLLIAATARLALPDRRAGMLSSRRKLVDVAIFTALGAGLLVAGLVIHAAS